MKIFLTGLSGSGKSTVLIKTIELLKEKNPKIGGITTPEIRKQGKRIGFSVKDVFTGKEGILASVDQKIGPRVGKYRIDLKEFERIALPALDFTLKNCVIICVDELGRMEFFSSKFKEKVLEILNSDKKVIACLHRNFIDEFKKYGKLIEVTLENREKLPQEIIKYF